jgi:dihydroorotate dehydrogenase
MLYRLARPLLFAMDAESAHGLGLSILDCFHAAGLSGLLASNPPALPVRVMGMDFPNPVGLAAGLDKNGDHIDALFSLGFGFIEVGAVTPRPQPGNPRPRIFRLPQAEAIINRMGFNNLGVDHLVENLKQRKSRGIIGVNLGKNFDTPLERAAEDYVACLTKVYDHASFVTANVSSPNTKGLRDLQHEASLDRLLSDMAEARARLAQSSGRRVPIAVKIAPDLEDASIDSIAAMAIDRDMDAIIATNTTVTRQGVEHLTVAAETGGLSGAPVRARSTHVVTRLASALRGKIPIIGVGGIANADHAREKLDAGASLVQIYSGMIYRGPGLAADIVRDLARARRPVSG